MRQFLDPGEYGLSKDVDVAQWFEYRNYNKINEAPLREVFDFVVVNTSLHAEFDEFKRKETHHHYSILLVNELFAYWNTYKRSPPLPVLRVYGKPHLQLHYTEVDDLCEWVIHQRKVKVSLPF